MQLDKMNPFLVMIYQYDKDDVDNLEECFELGVDDFVEDGEIDKKDYIIGNFYDPNPEFDGYDPFELGDYTNYEYYNIDLWERDECDWDDMYEQVRNINAVTPILNPNHSVMSQITIGAVCFVGTVLMVLI